MTTPEPAPEATPKTRDELLQLLITTIDAIHTSWDAIDQLEDALPIRCPDLDEWLDAIATNLNRHDPPTPDTLDNLLATCELEASA